MEISFNLQIGKKEKQKLNAEARRSVYMFFSLNGKSYKFNIGQKVAIGDWNFSKRKPKSIAPTIELRERIKELDDKTRKIHRERTAGKPMTAQLSLQIIQDVEAMLKGKVSSSSAEQEFEDAVHKWLKYEQERKAPETIKYCKTFVSHLNEYQKHTSPLTFASIDWGFSSSFKKYLYEQGLAQSTVNKYTSSPMKWFFKWARKRYKSVAPDVLETDFYEPSFSRRDNHPALSEAEFKALQELDISTVKVNWGKRGARTPEAYPLYRDFFLFMAFTGLRVSDAISLKREDIKSTVHPETGNHIRWIEKYQQKTKSKVVAPLLSEAWNILEKYREDHTDGFCFPTIHPQKVNKAIKNICRVAGIDSPFEIDERKKRSEQPSIVEYPKWKLVSNHTARRTTATYLKWIGVTNDIIAIVLGHSQGQKTTERYIKLSPREKAIMLYEKIIEAKGKKTSFFKLNSKAV